MSVITNVVDFDLWARIVVGKTFFQTGELLNFDFQSFGPTRQWFDHEWGSSLVFYHLQITCSEQEQQVLSNKYGADFYRLPLI